MRIDTRLPQQPAAAGVQCVGVAVEVAEPQARLGLRVTGRPRLQRRAGAHLGFGLEGPAHTAGLEIERVHRTVLTADIHRARAHGRLRPGARGAGEGERPGDAEPRHIGGGETRALGGDVTRAFEGEPPAGQGRRPTGVEVRSRRVAARQGGCGVGQGGATEEFGEGVALADAQGLPLRLHDPRLEGGQDGPGADHLELDRVGCPGDPTLVAGRAVLFVKVSGRGGRPRGRPTRRCGGCCGGGRSRCRRPRNPHPQSDTSQKSEICQILHRPGPLF